jgi:hypothetical protein
MQNLIKNFKQSYFVLKARSSTDTSREGRQLPLRLSGDRTSAASEVGIRRQPEGTVATTWNYRRDMFFGGRKDAVLQRGGRSAKQQLSTKQNNTLHTVTSGFSWILRYDVNSGKQT